MLSQAAKKSSNICKEQLNLASSTITVEEKNSLPIPTMIMLGILMTENQPFGYVFLLRSGAICWSSKKQLVATLFTKEAEFIAATYCACQAIWLRKILEKIELPYKGTSMIHYDNNSTIKLSKNSILYGRSKHINVGFNF